MSTALPRWAQVVVPWSAGASAFTGRRIAVFGLLWGTAQTAVSSYGLPLEGLSASEFVRVMFEIFLSWSIMGIGGAYVAKVIAIRFKLPMVALSIAMFAFGVSAARFAVEAALGIYDLPLFRRSFLTSILFESWTFFFYGGLFILGCIFGLRSEHTRDLLGQAEIARGQTEALLSEAELQTLRGHVDPALLLRVMAEVQRRYASDAAGADRLLEQLVNFLRRAMPGVRNGTSTLAAEVKLARAHARLIAEVDLQHTIWRIRVEPGLGELPFPPLLLLPVLDALAAACAPGSTCALTLERTGGADSSVQASGFLLRLYGPISVPHWLPEALERRLRVGLGAVLGHAWSLLLGDAAMGAPALVLTLDSAAPHGVASQRLVSTPDLETQDE